MTKVNPKNEAIKVAWIDELERDDAPSTIDHKLAALALYEQATDYVDFTALSLEAVDQFLEAVEAMPTRGRTDASKVNSVKSFFEWMVLEERIKGKQAHKPIKALRLTRKARTKARACKSRPIATIVQIVDTIAAMPKTSAVERRNRALIAFTLLSGARDAAIISMRLKHVDIGRKEVIQDPNEVDTKASKQINTWFFPVGQLVVDEVTDYIAFLKDTLGFAPNDYLFTATAMGMDETQQFTIAGLTKKRWASAQPMRDIFKTAFKAQGLDYYNPHSFRKTLMQLAYDKALDGEALKAWSQNLGHEKLDTSINSYGAVSLDRQRARMLAMHNAPKAVDKDRAELIVDILAVIDAREKGGVGVG